MCIRALLKIYDRLFLWKQSTNESRELFSLKSSIIDVWQGLKYAFLRHEYELPTRCICESTTANKLFECLTILGGWPFLPYAFKKFTLK